MPLSLSAAVGDGAASRNGNLSADVVEIQRALAGLAEFQRDPRLNPGPDDGIAGDGTEGAITHFQRTIHVASPDARIDPGGLTERCLNAHLGVMAAAESGRLVSPVEGTPTHPFHGPGAGMRAFRARRSSGTRSHAGDDLYRPDFTPVYAMDHGVVLRVAPFYLGTWVVTVDHGWGIVRYGELDRDVDVRVGDEVSPGMPLGRIGILTRANGRRLGVPSMMLHLELYDRTLGVDLGTHPLTPRRNQRPARDRLNGSRTFARRRDLMDPTGLLLSVI